MRTLAAVLLVSCVFPCAAQIPPSSRSPCPRTITVTATGTAAAQADLAIVHVGYQMYGPDAKTAYAEGVETSSAVMEALIGAAVSRDDIESTSQALVQTQGYELQQYPMDSEQRHNHEFTVMQGWAVRVKPDEAAKVLNAAIRAGANHSGWIEWSVSDENHLRSQAAAEAATNAWAMADQIAAKLKVHIVRLQSASQSPEYPGGYGGGVMGGVGAALQIMTPNNQPLAIHSRRVEVKTTLQATFEIQ